MLSTGQVTSRRLAALGELAHAPRRGPAHLAAQGGLRAHHALGSSAQPAQHPHAIP